MRRDDPLAHEAPEASRPWPPASIPSAAAQWGVGRLRPPTLHDSVKVPASGYALELVLAGVLERQFARAAEHRDGFGDENLVGPATAMIRERIVARGGLLERRGLGFQAETEPLRLHQVVITAKPYTSTPSKSTTA